MVTYSNTVPVSTQHQQEFESSMMPLLKLLISEVLMKKTRHFQQSTVLFNPGN